ncbi:alpha-ketoacid dehydrogenase kinase [Microthyrium microscopicum]|uniref:Protein-serine/threonine kinase n=1 Tax=Microthyrium microscopicum TaxID=703497 RepID=A0A6A6U8F2_9PEZI|nr:alpha-ketoacid dehydrogenase kinase [Microthyrium microscopicum]
MIPRFQVATCGSRRLASLTRPIYQQQLNASRALSTAAVTDEVVMELAAKPLHRLTLADLVKHGRPPLSASSLYRSANFTLSILPTRLAQRIQSLRNLPFIVVTNPHISKIHSNYMHSLSTLLPWAQTEIDSVEAEREFTEVMVNLVQTHADTIPILARGFLEARKYTNPAKVTRFLDEHLRARIGTRLIAEQHIALHYSSLPHLEAQNRPIETDESMASFIGVIDTALCPATVIRHCEAVVGDICEFKYGVRPHVVINGEPGYTFAQIPVHLEYIITELLKNAFRASIEKRMEREPIEITIAPLPEPTAQQHDENPEHNEFSVSYDGIDSSGGSVSYIGPMAEATPGVTIRIRDRGGGISPETYRHIWDYSFTTFSEEQIQNSLTPGAGEGADNPMMDGLSLISSDGGSTLAGLGYGLPLGRAYAEYFGGGIAVQSLWGWGTDVYLSLKGVGRVDGLW